MKKGVVLALMIVLAACAVRAADTDSILSSLTDRFDRFARMFPQERVYVHFDNTSYYKGESIWYKAYVVRDDNLHPSNLSTVLYVELLNPIGYPVETQKLMVSNGQAHGSFLLKDTLRAGFYEVRAYTAWMLNFTTGDPHGWDRLRKADAQRHYGERFQRYLEGNAGIFSRVFPIYEKVDSGHYSQRRIPFLQKSTSSALDPVKDKLKIDFYPEGGNLIQDVPTRIAFQAHNTEGRTLNVEGALMRRGDSIGYFRTDYAGRGFFSVTPDSTDVQELTEGLQLKLTYQGHNYRFDLPKPKRRGYSLSVFNAEHQMKAVVTRNQKTKGMRLGLSVSSRGRTFLINTIDLQTEEQAALLIDHSSLQTGVNVVTLFTERGQVLAQRLVFVNNHDMDGLRLRRLTPTDTLEPYSQVTLDYQLVDQAGRAVKAVHDFSIAVTDRNTREESYDDNNILSYLLLSSEVKGFIPHPEYYFEADDREHHQALDVLLMIQGWTRYDYEQMMSGETFEPMLAIERGLTFAGRLWDDNDYASRRFWKLQNKKPTWVYSEINFTDDSVAVQTPGADEDVLYPSTITFDDNKTKIQFLMGEAKIDSAGCFRLNMPPFFGKGRIALVLNKESIEELGMAKGGIGAHNFRWNTIRRPRFLLGKRIEPLNQYSPLPKNYDYYETAALNDPIERDMFRYGFMTVPDKKSSQKIYYDAVNRTYMLPEVQKKKRRRWNNFRDTSPVCVMDVKDMMAWLSNIYGDISDFSMRKNSPYSDGSSYDGEQVMNEMMLEDAARMDAEYGTNLSAQVIHSIAAQQSHKEYEIDNSDHYARLAELLYIFGIDGTNEIYLDAQGLGDLFVNSTGDESLLPHNVHFFPVNENFKDLELYADVDNRRLTHQAGRYLETVFSNTSNYDIRKHPLTSVFNFRIGNDYDNGYRMPDFQGFRINFQGFTRPAEFFQPDYSWEPEPEDTDYRRTVYWNPQVTTDGEGRAHIEFYNNGFSKRLAVSAEGLTANGQPIIGGSRDEELKGE